MHARPSPHPAARPAVRAAILAVVVTLASNAAAQDAWTWFAEPFTTDLTITAPGQPPMEARLAVDARDVRLAFSESGMEVVMLLRLVSEGVEVTALIPGDMHVVTVFGPDEFPELAEQGFAPVVTAPDDPAHPCVAEPDRFRCERLGSDEVDGRTAERWRVDVTEEDGTVHGSTFWFDRSEGRVVRTEDDDGVRVDFTNHRPGPPEAGAFEVPAGSSRMDLPEFPMPPGF